MTHDFASTAVEYLTAGWLPFPIKPGEAAPYMRGITGRNGFIPSGPDVYEWIESAAPGSNVGLRLSHDVIMIDVDNYSDKPGARTLHNHIQKYGPLPPTWRNSARDWPSGHWPYRVPPGLHWPNKLDGGGVELLTYVNRYAIVWPSTNVKTGHQYQWYRPIGDDGEDEPAGRIPRVDELPWLPDAWVQGLTGGALDSEVASRAVDGGEADTWLAAHDEPGGCPRVAGTVHKMLAELDAGTGHDSLAHLVTLARQAEHGHRGVRAALETVRGPFLALATAHGRGHDANGEFSRSWRGAVGKILATPEVHTPEAPCDCGQDPEDLVDRSTPPPPELGPDGEPVPLERSSWEPVDLTGVIDGSITTEPPTVLRRADDQPLFYPSRVNGLIGESESGKTWIALLAVAQELDAGHHVLYIDPEDLAPGFVERMRAVGATDEQLSSQVVYLNPDEPLRGTTADTFQRLLASRDWTLIVLDGVNACMTLLGYDIDASNKDATRFAQNFLKPLAATGAAVAIVDHLPKNNAESKGGIGAQAKRAMMTGCSMRVAVTTEFGRGLKGKLSLTVDKDRQGHVRGASRAAKHVGTAVLDSDGSKMALAIEAPDDRPAAERAADFRPTGVMTEVSRWLAGNGSDDGWSTTQVAAGTGRRKEIVITALDRLVEGGYVRREPGKRNAVLHHHLHRYSEINELTESDEED